MGRAFHNESTGRGGDEYSSTAFPLNPDGLLAVDMRFVARITLVGASHMPIFTSIATRALPGWIRYYWFVQLNINTRGLRTDEHSFIHIM